MKHNSYSKSFGCMLVALLVAGPTLGLAANSPSERYFNKRVYIGAGLGISELAPESTTDALSITENNDTSASLRLGYDLTRRFSIDAYAADLGTADVSFIGTPVGGVDYQVYGVSLISYLTNLGSSYSDVYDDDGLFQREGLSTYLRVGIGGMSNDTDRVDYDRDYSTHFVMGLGLEHGWSNGVALRAEITSYDKDANELSMSLLKRFGDASYAVAAAPVAAVVAQAAASETIAVEPVEPPVLLEKPIVLFSTDEKRIQNLYIAVLKRLAVSLNDYPDIKIKIDGHADWTGPAEYNLDLSQRRAAEVRDFLAANGLDPDRVVIEGFGELKPIADNNTERGRARNRRVEISRLP